MRFLLAMDRAFCMSPRAFVCHGSQPHSYFQDGAASFYHCQGVMERSLYTPPYDSHTACCTSFTATHDHSCPQLLPSVLKRRGKPFSVLTLFEYTLPLTKHFSNHLQLYHIRMLTALWLTKSLEVVMSHCNSPPCYMIVQQSPHSVHSPYLLWYRRT